MKRLFLNVSAFVGWFSVMLLIGAIAYQIGEHGTASSLLERMDADSRLLILQNALISATALTLWIDFVKNRQRRKA